MRSELRSLERVRTDPVREADGRFLLVIQLISQEIAGSAYPNLVHEEVASLRVSVMRDDEQGPRSI